MSPPFTKKSGVIPTLYLKRNFDLFLPTPARLFIALEDERTALAILLVALFVAGFCVRDTVLDVCVVAGA